MARKFSDGKFGAALPVRITPRSSRNEIVEIMSDNTIKIKLTAPPVEGKANAELVKLLSRVLGVSKSSVAIVKGHTGRSKAVAVKGMSREEITSRLSV